MNHNTKNTKIAAISEKTLIVGIDVGSEIHYARVFDWRQYEYSKKPFAFSNDKNDWKDPRVIAGLVTEGRYNRPYIPEGIYAEIRSLSNLRLQT